MFYNYQKGGIRMKFLDEIKASIVCLFRMLHTADQDTVVSDPVDPVDPMDRFWVTYDLSTIQEHITIAAALLDTPTPKILVAPYMADYNGTFNVLDMYLSEIPLDMYAAAYFDQQQNRILLSRNDPTTQQPLSDAEMLLFALHELRHAWQYKNHQKEYYATNAVGGNDHIKDPAEIDADAFALAYMENKTSYVSAEYGNHIFPYLLMDGGARVKRKKEIIHRYFAAHG